VIVIFIFLELEESFIEKLINNDRRAQLLLYEKCFSILMSVAIRYKNNEEDAKSLAISAFLKILTNIENYNPKIPFEAWIRRISINNAIDDFRKNQKRKDIVEYKDEIKFEKNYTINEYEYEIRAEELNSILLKLPKATNTVFNLFAIDGYSHKEISERIGITINTSKWHVKEARKKLKNLLLKKQELIEK
jgi:RNA polymerase sigma factor (sigma-70 family)